MSNLPRTPEEYREWWSRSTEQSYGRCWCGCKAETKIAKVTDRSNLYFRNQPLRYIDHHANRIKGPEYIEDPKTGCWVWQHSRHDKGPYGAYGRYGRNGDRRLAHVVYWERENGPVPAGTELHHRCVEEGYGTMLCCRPSHLTPVSHAENVRRGKKAILTVEQVQSIKARLAEGITHRELGECFGVEEVTISAIATGRNWGDVKP